ncbi:hypothetical protein DFH08DRAFT_32203 [Mycena albidolilacea]|uniref:F-box domain-containing protein n=1 Tax=Mycena albidolilacea TaxID=1033008 RepID=A0AAD7AVE2_9AGAR|nr:hypothetical protein DFH08DRAFT_32203 [Mycena albidolilacea]
MHVDMAHIQSLIDAKRNKISNLASQIQEITRLREVEINELVALQAMISRVAILPTELLANIVHLVVPPEGFWDGETDKTDEIVAEAHRVSQVSRHWRQIAHATPQLWVDGFSFCASEKSTRLALEQTMAWLERSSPLPITIFFHCTGGADGLPSTAYTRTELFSTLLSAIHRWKHVIWDIPHLFPLYDLTLGSFEALERFSIESRMIKWPPKFMDVFLTAPRLREVIICIRDDPRRHPWSLPHSLEPIDTSHSRGKLQPQRLPRYHVAMRQYAVDQDSYLRVGWSIVVARCRASDFGNAGISLDAGFR